MILRIKTLYWRYDKQQIKKYKKKKQQKKATLWWWFDDVYFFILFFSSSVVYFRLEVCIKCRQRARVKVNDCIIYLCTVQFLVVVRNFWHLLLLLFYSCFFLIQRFTLLTLAVKLSVRHKHSMEQHTESHVSVELYELNAQANKQISSCFLYFIFFLSSSLYTLQCVFEEYWRIYNYIQWQGNNNQVENIHSRCEALYKHLHKHIW